MADTWKWVVARDYNGTVATIITTLASDEDIADFRDRFESDGSLMIDRYERPAGVHWDGGRLWPEEIADWTARPYAN